MSFETIKTIKGKKYGYKVESYREGGKTKQRILEYRGRIDKPKPADIEPIVKNGINIADGFYYFSQEGCSACSSENTLREDLEPYLQRAGLQADLNYINVSKENTTPIKICCTPTMIYIEKGGLHILAGIWDYLIIKLGKKQYEAINAGLKAEKQNKRSMELKQLVESGKKYRELINKGYSKEEIRIAQSKPIKTQKEMLREQKKEQVIKNEMEEMKQRIAKINNEEACKDGVCQVS